MSLTDDIVAKRGTWQLFDRVGEYDLSLAVTAHIDHKGRLWLRLPGALLCTDGQHVLCCHAFEALSRIKIGLEGFGADDRFWILTQDFRLLSVTLDDGTIDDHSAALPPLNEVYWLWTSLHADILLGEPGTLMRYNGTETTRLDVPRSTESRIHAATITPDGEVWLTTHLGLHHAVDGGLKLYEQKLFHCESLWDLISDRNGTLWIPAAEHLVRFDNGRIDLVTGHEFGASFTCTELLIDDEENVWLGLHFRGTMCMTSSTSVVFPIEDTPAQRWPKGMVQDRERCFWMIGVGNGVLRYDPRRLHVVQRGYMEAVARDADGTWVMAAASKGLLAYDGSGITQLSPKTPPRCTAVCQLKNGDVFLASSYGSYVYDAASAELLNLRDIPRLASAEGLSMHRAELDYEQNLWVCTPTHVLGFRSSGVDTHAYDDLGFRKDRALLFRDSTDTLWILQSGDAPVHQFGRNGFGRVRDQLGDCAGSEYVTCCFEDTDRALWMGTEDGRVVRHCMDTGTTERIMDLGHDVSVRDIHIDQNQTKWISTTHGLFVSDGTHTYRMTEACGLPSRTVIAVYAAKDEGLVIVSELGLCEYRPRRAERPYVFVSKVVADRSYIRPEGAIKTEARPRLDIYINAVNMKPGPLQYQVRLEGHSGEWTDTVQEAFHYDDLPVGRYRFEVRAIDQDLMSTEAPVVLDIEVTPDTREIHIAELQGELRGARDFAENIIHSINEAIIVLDTDGMIATTNAAASALLGYTRADLVGQPASRLLPQQHSSLFGPGGLEALRAELRGRSQELEMQASDGSARSVMLSAACMMDRAGELQGYVLAASDITEYKALQSQMLHDQKMESLGVLAGGIAHDFNNLLAVMMGNADLIQADTETQSPQHQYLLDIMAAGEKATKLCSEMLVYSGEGRQIREPLNVSQIVRENADLLKSSIPGKVAVEYELDETLPAVWGDEVQLMQIVLNLVINAAEAIGDDAGVIVLSTRAGTFSREDLESRFCNVTPGAGDYVRLRVRDTGCGMNSQTLQRAFEPFFTTKFTGRGLGLSAIHGIVTSHGGAIKAFSQPGQGTVFEIYLPTHEGAPPAPSEPEAEAPTHSSGTVLVVEDQADMLALSRRMLAARGLACIEAVDGLDGIEKFQQHRDSIDLVMLDMKMPKMDGAEVYKRLREMCPKLPIVICSGFSETCLADRFETDDHLRFLYKPYSLDELSTTIEAMLPGRRMTP